MKKMKRLSIMTALLMALGPTTIPSLAHAGDRDHGHRHHGPRTVRDKGRFVSNGINQVALQVADGTPVGQAILIESQGEGRSGKSESRGLMQWDLDTVTFSPDCYEGGFGLIFPIVQYSFRTTYSDLSSVHGTLREGELCVNFVDRSQTLFSFEVNVIGGTGRFAGATGVERFWGKTQALPSDSEEFSGRFSVSEGRYESTLTLP